MIWRIFVSIILLLAFTIRPAAAQGSQNLTPTPDPTPAYPVSVYFRPSNPQPLIGEPFTLYLVVEMPPYYSIESWPEFPESWHVFEITEVGEPTTNELDEEVQIEQALSVVVWRTGEYRTPRTTVDIGVRTIDEQLLERITVPAISIPISIPSILDSQDLELRQEKGPIALLYIHPLVILLSAAALSTTIYAAWKILRIRRKNRILAADASGIIPPYDRAVSRLRALQNRDLPVESLYLAMTDCLRAYIEAEFSLPAQEMTTAELIDTLKQKPEFTKESVNDLARLLDQADMVKFARVVPATDVNSQLIQYAIHWLNTIQQAGETHD